MAETEVELVGDPERMGLQSEPEQPPVGIVGDVGGRIP